MRTNVIYNEDCLKGMKKLRSESVEVVVTSPPYNIGINYNSYQDTLEDSEFLMWISDIAQEIKRILKEDGSFFLNVGGKPSQPLWPLQVAMACARHFFLQNTIHWIKSIAIPMEDVGNYPHMIRDISVGHFKPVNSRYYLNNCHEYIFHFTKSGTVEIDKLAIGVEYQDKSNVNRWKSSKSDLRDRGNTWFIPYETIRISRPHPAPFPVKLPEYCIKIHGLNRTKTVLDPFMGIGGTALACIRLGVAYIGYELDEEYAKIARMRISSEKSRLATQPSINVGKVSKLYRVIVDGLDPTEMEPLTREVNGTGGYQSFIRKLQRQYSPKEGQIILDIEDIQRMPRYVTKYGQGGFQDRLSFLMNKLEDIHNKLDNAVESYKSNLQD